jgi:hypothetical protein
MDFIYPTTTPPAPPEVVEAMNRSLTGRANPRAFIVPAGRCWR